MAVTHNGRAIPRFRRKEIFLTIVQMQDGGSSVEESRTEVAKFFRLTVDQVKLIEEEGLAEDWPPLEV